MPALYSQHNDIYRRNRYGEGMGESIPQDGLARPAHMDGRLPNANNAAIPAATAKRGRTPGTKVIKNCQGCQHQIAAALTKCPHCGHVYREKKQKGTRSGKRGRKLCPHCQHENPAATAACKSCNYKFRLKIGERFGRFPPRPNQAGANAATRRPMPNNTNMGNSNINHGSSGMGNYGGLGTSQLHHSGRDLGHGVSGLGSLGNHTGSANYGGLSGGPGGLIGSNYGNMTGGSGANIGGGHSGGGIGFSGVQGMRGAGGYAGLQGGQGGMHTLSSLGGGGAQGLGGLMGSGHGGIGLGGMQHMPSYARGNTGDQDVKYDNMHNPQQQQQRYQGM
eukprot:CAMPEP_0198737584 /NCGR_PEP_ID=MMETSP1475-20131203/67942_1 /TAXON_ID= ORGANISM="Unidentified sp., Strain CCMP1999" /NCGR_SAMPLE_ID=MMETSP1475 /ASSEMBLY_ACC=CAM_ASM_001111 /LENGTH=333 /DNA_ID=CAMNT_0044501451 /DNA_START=97 /DNA_END=1098 /DNA_ORIENTATION=-